MLAKRGTTPRIRSRLNGTVWFSYCFAFDGVTRLIIRLVTRERLLCRIRRVIRMRSTVPLYLIADDRNLVGTMDGFYYMQFLIE